MSSDSPNRNVNGTFKKGFTANRKGAPPKSRRKPPVTAYDILLDDTFEPVARDLPEGLLPIHEPAYRTYVAALKKGSKRARRVVLKHIRRRDEERLRLARLNEQAAEVKQLLEPRDPRNADDALLILGIARTEEPAHAKDRTRRIKLLPWAVQAALGRRHGGKRLTRRQIEQINLWTEDSDTLRWPRGYEPQKRPR